MTDLLSGAADDHIDEPTAGATRELPRNLKILHVFDHSLPLHSGYSFRSRALLREQMRRGWEVVNLTTPKHATYGQPIETNDGLTFHRTPPVKGWGALWPGIAEARLIVSVARRIREIVTAEKPDIIHAHSPALNAAAALMAAKQLGLPVVYEVRAFWEDAAVANHTTYKGSLRYRLTRTLETLAAKRSDAVVTICQALAEDLYARGVPREKIKLVPNGVDLTAFPMLARERPSAEAAALRRSLSLEGALVLGFLGSFYPYEGLDLLLTAMPGILAVQPRAKLLLAGGGPQEADLRAQVDALGLSEKVRMVGRIPQGALLPYFEIVDLFVFPRRRERLTETVTPLKPLEAMATGGVVLASDVGGHRELIRHGETGILFSADSPRDIGRAVLSAANGHTCLREVATRARQFIERERTWRTCTAGYEDAFLAALAQRRGGGKTPAPRTRRQEYQPDGN